MQPSIFFHINTNTAFIQGKMGTLKTAGAYNSSCMGFLVLSMPGSDCLIPHSDLRSTAPSPARGQICCHLPAQVRQQTVLPASLQATPSGDRNFYSVKRDKSVFWIYQPISGKSFSTHCKQNSRPSLLLFNFCSPRNIKQFAVPKYLEPSRDSSQRSLQEPHFSWPDVKAFIN